MRIKTPTVKIRGGIAIGGNTPIVIQSMTNTDTSDVAATAQQCMELAQAGSEIVRITVNNEAAAEAVPAIRQILSERGFDHLPLVGDFHYNGHSLLKDYPEMATTLDKYRINPGNVGYGDKHDYNFAEIIGIAVKNNKPVRIGVNGGSLDQDLLTELMDKNAKSKTPKSDNEIIVEAMVESALRSAESAVKLGLAQDMIILSTKMSDVQDVVKAYEQLAEKMKKNGQVYALHLGLTEAGSGMHGIVSSSAALAILLQKGIGDTIRISLTQEPNQSRITEVEVCKSLLQSMGYRNFRPKITSCPGCGRTEGPFFQELAHTVNEHIEKNIDEWLKLYPGVENLKISVMGCVVNGPGESQNANIAISLPGKSEDKVALLFIDGQMSKNLQGNNIAGEFLVEIEEYIARKFNRK